MINVSKLLTVLDWVEDVNIDIIDSEVVPGVTVEEFKQLKETLRHKLDGDYITELTTLKEELDANVQDMFDRMDNDQEYDTRHNVQVIVRDKLCTLHLSADLYDGLSTTLKLLIDES